MFVAANGNIGGITIANAGPGASALASAFVAMPKGTYGPVSLTGPTLANLFGGNARTSNSSSTPQVTATSITPPASGSYNASAVLTFKVNFSGSVAVTGQPTFPVQVGSTTGSARYQSGSGSPQLLFTIAVNPGDSANITIAPGTTIQTDLLNRIVDSATGGELTQLTPESVGSSNVVVDTTAPTVTNVSPILATPTPHHGRKYDVGELLTVLVTFSEPVLVTGIPTKAMTIGGLDRSLAYSSSSGTDTLRFTDTIVRADVKTHQAAQTDGMILLPPVASITDVAGNAASLPTVAGATVANVATQGSYPVTTHGKRFHRALVAHPAGRVRAHHQLVGSPALAARAIVAKHGLGIAMGIEPSSKFPFRH
ncbi:MAG: hypothetical protein ACYC61_12720 [Isosphaeraceae bacterium]